MELIKFFLLIVFIISISACKNNAKLSPIDISDAENNPELMSLYADYLSYTGFVIDNTGKAISVYIDGSILIVADENDYMGAELVLERFDIKSPSEHTIEGKQFPLEIQFHHVDSIGKTVIASVFVIEGQENSEFQIIIDNLPQKDKPKRIENSLNPYYLFSMGLNYWTYQGSFTDKPYDGDVQWYIMKEPIEVSSEQIAAIVEAIGKNNNKIIEIGDRIITKF